MATCGNWHLSVADPPRPLDSDYYALLPSPKENWVGGDAGNTLVLSGALARVHTLGVSQMQTTSKKQQQQLQNLSHASDIFSECDWVPLNFVNAVAANTHNNNSFGTKNR